MSFRNSILAGEELVRSGIRSENYVAGASGWRIARNGDAEFNDVTVRGDLITGDFGEAHVRILDGEARVRMYSADPDPSAFGVIEVAGSGSNALVSVYPPTPTRGVGYIRPAVELWDRWPFTGAGLNRQRARIVFQDIELSGKVDAFGESHVFRATNLGTEITRLTVDTAGISTTGRLDVSGATELDGALDVLGVGFFHAIVLGPRNKVLVEGVNGPGFVVVGNGDPQQTGIMIQTGTTVLNFGGGNSNIGWPMAFPNGLLSIVVTNGDSGGSTFGPRCLLSTSNYLVNECGITAIESNTGAGANGLVRVNYIVTGW